VSVGFWIVDNSVLSLSYDFSLHNISLYRYLLKEQNEYVLSKQLLRAGTSIGANINEAQAAISRKDFIAKCRSQAKKQGNRSTG
jgi:four helix bundle protein